MATLLKRLRYRVLFPALARLPLSLAYGIAAGIGLLEYLCRYRERRAVAAGLCRVWPRLRERPRLLHGILRRHFIMKAWECLDTFVMAYGPPERANRLVRIDGLEKLQRARMEGRGVILVMAHFGRINLHAMGLALRGERLGMLTMNIKDNPQLDPVERDYLLFKSATLHRFIRGRWVTIGSSLRQLHRGLKEGETLIILLDAYVPGWNKKPVILPFLGGRLALPSGILRLMRHTGARLVYAAALQQGWRVRGLLAALPEDPEAGFRAAVRCLERDVRQYPWLWWLWPVVGSVWQASDRAESSPGVDLCGLTPGSSHGNQ